MRNYNDFLHGFNKVKMSTKRSESIFFDHITKNRDKAIKLSIKSGLSAFGNELLGDYFFYFLIGTVLFILPTFFSIDATVISGFMITLLFLMGPIAMLINLMESIISYKVAFRRINEFNDTLTDNLNDSDSTLLSASKELPVFETIYTNNIDYQHIDGKGNITFELKPVNLKINKAEVIFISGSNGSGKSTFINLLSGLYSPKSGGIFVNDILITDSNRQKYRDMISCIFSDNYLFTENYDNFNLLSSNEHLTELLKKMKLDKTIRQDVAKNRIFQNLSSGQQKRLALIYSVLEDKDVFIFDEWAAEQDPEFRKYFYKIVIPELKNKGKTVIAITHDDAYYKYCDRLLKFNYGEMLEHEMV
jgi:cyclic peptide transporter